MECVCACEQEEAAQSDNINASHINCECYYASQASEQQGIKPYRTAVTHLALLVQGLISGPRDER